jgi:hypothetical protein
MTDRLILPDLLRREARSFLQYVHESYPWAKGDSEKLRVAILQIAEAEAAHNAKLGRLMQKRHLPWPGLGAYPTSFTNSNFLDAAALVPKLLAAERQSLADLERDLLQVSDEETRAALQAYRDLKRQHVEQFESLAGAKV